VSEHILQIDEGSDGIKKEGLLNIPLEVIISDNYNQNIYSQSITLNKLNSGFSSAELFENKIKVRPSISFGEFRSNSNLLKVILKINPDTEYGAIIEALTISVYDNIKPTAGFLKIGLIFAVLGFLVAMFAWTKSTDRNNFTVAIILSVLFGGFGLDRFYLGYF